MQKNLLLLSNSTNPGEAYLSWPQTHLAKHFENVNEVLFIPFAGFALGYDSYEKAVKDAFEKINKKVVSIHRFDDPINAIENCEAIAVGGGNTFYLFNELHQQKLIEPIRKKVNSGTPYAGWSAGSNTACPTLRTTNDMPIVEPPSFDGLRLIPFQINPHYTNKTIEGHGGESRDQRLKEFMAANQKMYVVGLPESSFLKVEKNSCVYIGNSPAKLFLYNEPIQDIEPNKDLSFLLNA